MKRFFSLILIVLLLIPGGLVPSWAANSSEAGAADVIRHIPLWELGQLCDLAYAVDKKGFDVPAPYQAFLTTDDSGCDFQGAAFYDAEAGAMIVAFTGTEMHPPDPADVISDSEIVDGQVQKLIQESFLRATGVSQARRDQVKVVMKPMLQTMVILAQKFTHDVYQKAVKEKKTLNEFILTGHSLGGFLAQIVGMENGLTTFTFNAPGARGFNKTDSDAVVENHIRRDDVVGTCGEHIGSLIQHPNVAVRSVKDALLFAKDNHSMERFYKDLKNPPAGDGNLKDQAARLVDETGKEVAKKTAEGVKTVTSAGKKGGAAVRKTADRVKKNLKKLKFW